MQTKQKISVSLSAETLRLEEDNRERLGFSSRSELTEVAIMEYIKGQTLRQFPEELARVYESIERREIKDMEDRMAKLLYKIAVEIAQMNLFLVSQMELSKNEIYDLQRGARSCGGALPLHPGNDRPRGGERPRSPLAIKSTPVGARCGQIRPVWRFRSAIRKVPHKAFKSANTRRLPRVSPQRKPRRLGAFCGYKKGGFTVKQYAWLDEYLLSKTGTVKDYKAEWGWHRYMVGGKMFAALMHPSDKYDPAYAEKDLINLKCDPMLAELLRNEHLEVMPGFYSDKRTWNSVDLNGRLPDDLLKQMIDDSYRLVFEKLAKKLQKEISEAAL